MVHLCRCLHYRGVNPCSSALERFLRFAGNSGCDQSSRSTHTDSSKTSQFWFDLDKLETLNRRELQQLCKKCGIKANNKTSILLSDLKEFHLLHLTNPNSVLRLPFIAQTNSAYHTPVKGDKRYFLPTGLRLDKNNILFSSTESPGQWISGEVKKLHKAVKSKGIVSKTVGEYKGTTNGTKQREFPVKGDLYLTKNASVSAILNTASNRFMIAVWQKQQIEKMGEEMFNEYRNLIAKSGKKFHSCMTDILHKKAEDTDKFPEIVSSLIKSVSKTGILKLLTKDKVLATEEYVTHSSIGYSGTFDGLAIYNGVPCVIEWKTSQKPRPTLESCYDAPFQVVAYAGAINSYPVMRIPVTSCLIVVAHHDGSEADVHWMDLDTCEKLWQQWLTKVLKYKEKTEHVSEKSDAS
ncbi:mitochondrial genome maintenance exonuclease 1-like [Stylophora pistillata]|uniref:mitochondrial genome maintenance exonuclease 1-like n=1 Tax=Stylophora pistillata TaxID=50429 RepID=UPI000C03B07E|nr:mitochondrial genome maintenance exonuclease 1-like [Stylophora pistillata]